MLKVIPKFDTDHNELLVYFDYFYIMICEAKIRLNDPPPIRNQELFVKNIEDALMKRDTPMIFNIFKRRQRDLVDRSEMS